MVQALWQPIKVLGLCPLSRVTGLEEMGQCSRFQVPLPYCKSAGECTVCGVSREELTGAREGSFLVGKREL